MVRTMIISAQDGQDGGQDDGQDDDCVCSGWSG